MKQESKLVQSLIRQVQSGKSSAFEQLYRTHVGRIYSFGLKFFERSKPAAEELTKRVFISAFEQINAYPENETFILWLRMMAVYEARNGDIEKSIGTYELRAVEEAIFSLPVEERIIYILHDVDKLQNEEITLITKDSVEHINIELSRARKLMMDKLKVGKLDDLDYKVAFLPKNVEPGREPWNAIFNAINKTVAEVPKNQGSIGKKFLGFFKKKS
jgi:DNA-directed RNA polymerase specialized sigma24 family protein